MSVTRMREVGYISVGREGEQGKKGESEAWLAGERRRRGGGGRRGWTGSMFQREREWLGEVK